MSTKLLAALAVTLPLCRIIKFIPEIPTSVYYGVYGLLALYVFFQVPYKTNVKLCWFLFVCVCSLVLNDVPSVFHAWERLISFIIIVAAVGPLFTNDKLDGMRYKSMEYLLLGIVAISVISFVMYYVARPLTITTRGLLFGGITIHSMTLSPLAGIASLLMFQKTFSKNWTLWNKVRIMQLTIALVCLFTCMLAGSRAALLSFLIGFIYYLWTRISPKSRFVWVVLGIIVVVGATSPFWMAYTETIQHKMEYAESKGSVMTTREEKWEKRIDEFKKDPLFGIGFGTVDISGMKLTKDYQGTIEPGNGWLFVLSSCGLSGFLLFLSIYYSAAKRLLKKQSDDAIFLMSLLIFIAAHMMAEGYPLSSGNFFFFVLWLALAIASGNDIVTRNKSVFV